MDVKYLKLRRNRAFRALAVVLLLSLLSVHMIACAPQDDAADTTDALTTVMDETTAMDETTGMDETTAIDETTAAEETTEALPPEKQDYVVSPAWHLGYVGSASNSSFKEKLNVGGSMYSYSDVINLGPAGSTITFTDDNKNSNGDTGFASASAYVFSTWKKVNGTFVIDTTGYKASGSDAKYTDNNGARTYTYTSTKDNECLRLCYRSGQSTSFTPAVFPVVTVHSFEKPVVELDGEGSVYVPEGTALNVKWNIGYVGSSTNPNGYANSIHTSEANYAYTDVIEVAKKGTKLTFVDTKGGATSGNAYTLSFWKKSDSGWVIDTSKYNIPGGGQYVITTESYGVLYTYITSEDNECIRFCFRSNGTSNRPTIYMIETNERGTLQDVVDAKASLERWVEEDTARAYFEILRGKTFTVIGDSYMAGNGLDQNLVWPALLAKKYGMAYQNYGVNGSTMSNYVTTNAPMVNRYTNMANNDPDIVIIEGGRNDYNMNVPLGEVGSTDTKTMRGAARYLISKVQEKYPNALIICLTVWEVGGNKNAAGNYCSDYGRALLEVCADMGVYCINAMDRTLTGVNMTSAAFRNQYCMGPDDISHLNFDGMKLVLPVFEQIIAEQYAEFVSKKEN